MSAAASHQGSGRAGTGAARTPEPIVVRTTSGPLRGTRTGHAQVFLDVPYAAPPRGDLRFAAPEPHPEWTDIRDAARPGPNAPQPPRNRLGRLDLSPFFGRGWERGVDYLTVNIWTPLASDGLAPVIVFVHGGAFIAGSTRGPVYDGTAFARDGTVFVTVNYRLGIQGFLQLPDAPDNRGRLDVIAALRWVQGNAVRFGGDVDNVTLTGQSAGGIIVSSIVEAPDARGLFRRAIIQSGSGTAGFTHEQAAIVNAAVGKALEVEPSAAGMRELADEQLVDVLPQLAGLDLTTKDAHDPLGAITPFSVVLGRQPADAVAEGGRSIVGLLTGSNLEESRLYLAPFHNLEESTDAEVRGTAARFHPDPDRLVQAYRSAMPAATTAELRVALLGDGMFGTGTRRFADAHAGTNSAPTFLYEFTWRSNALNGQLGSCHLMELPFVFDRADLPALHGPAALLGTTAPPADLASRMHQAWVRFATDGDPGWPTYTPRSPMVALIGETWQHVKDPHSRKYSAWH